MIVLHVYNLDCGYLCPIYAAIRFAGNGGIGRLKDQPVEAIQIDGELPGAIPFKLMAVAGQIPHIFQTGGCAQFIESLPDFVCSKLTMFFGQLFLAVECVLKAVRRKRDVQ
jgi:hypothetical protein